MSAHAAAQLGARQRGVRPMYIDGQWRLGSGAQTDADLNPATGEVLAHVAQAAAQDVEDAIAAAYRAREPWRKHLAVEREAILFAAADLIALQADEISRLLIAETGSVTFKAQREVRYASDCLRVAAGCVRQASGDTFPASTLGQVGMSIRQPLGVIAGIAPFNSPILLAMKKVAFALAAGNTFVLKPSEFAPLCGLKLAEIFDAVKLPAGVLNVIPGSAEVVGQKLVSDPRVRMVTFTGSKRVGQLIAAEAGRHMKRVTLELGGKNPLVVLADADLEYAIDAAAFGSFFHQGQVCMCSSRLIVEEPVYERFCDQLVSKAKSLKVGDPSDPATIIGPLIKPAQCEFIAHQIQDAVEKGARIRCGGTYSGSYFEPTVLSDVTPAMTIYHEESFGPVTTVLRARDFEHALGLANDTPYGLSAAIVTNDLQKAFEFSQRVHSGMVHVNDTTLADEPHVPFGGVQDSGLGREGGMASIEEMMEVKWVTFQLGRRKFLF
jgi:acyl-CoA reductase-like NAD-dependent aldehyde dehydrogenase